MSSSERAGTARVRRDASSREAPRATLRVWEPALASLGPLDGSESPGAARAAAYDEGYRAGWEAADGAARAGAAAVAAAERSAAAGALARAAEAIAAARAEAVATAVREAVALAVDLAEAFLQRELALSGSLDAEAVARALALAPAGEDLVVRLHPDHVLDLDELRALVPGRSVRIAADRTVARGGCVLEAGPCRIDSQLGPALERARALVASLGGDGGPLAEEAWRAIESPRDDAGERSR